MNFLSITLIRKIRTSILTNTHVQFLQNRSQKCVKRMGIIIIPFTQIKRSDTKSETVHFLRGYNAMLERISPSQIICFGTSFEEMEGNIIPIDYMESRKVVR